jgi:3-hydroxyacyl-[acyl-carrier-protein] dehydratase
VTDPIAKSDTNTKSLKTPIGIHEILTILPHRYPFVLIDRVTEIKPGESVRGHKCVSINEPWFPGHFPGRPIMPGVLIVEALAQIGGILAHATDPFDPALKLMLFLGIDKARFRRPVVPGDKLELQVSILQRRSTVWKLKGEASVDGARCAEAELLAAIADRESIAGA